MTPIMKKIHILTTLLAFAFLTACTPKPENVKVTTECAPIYPDYTDVTIPYNIAPLNFMIEKADGLQVIVKGKNDSILTRGTDRIQFPMKAWKKILQQHKGGTLQVSVTARINGQWLSYPDFQWQVAPEPIDGYLSYRLIEPGYEVWNNLQLRERCIETFDEKVIADNKQIGDNCMNCHIYGHQSGQLSMFHLRGSNGGTILNRNGELRKLSLKNDSMISAAVYGDFHPSGRYAVFSSNIIIPAFHAQGNKRLEVYDTQSDLAIADFEQNRMILSPLTRDKNTLETFPTFSADGKWIYYCTAPQTTLPDSIKQLRYSLCRIGFNAAQGTWGTQVDTVWNANTQHGSVCFPKVSPDGKCLLFTVSSYGTFPIWHREADLYMLNLATGKAEACSTANSDRSDTYHCWASNSRWFVFASKRGDGQYGKPYFAYVDKNGKVRKPFVLPQKNPEHYFMTFKSYNIPELSKSPVVFDAARIKQIYESQPAEKFR